MASPAPSPQKRGERTAVQSRPSGRIPPHSEEAERGVLGAALLLPERVLDLAVEKGLREEAFYDPRHRLIYKAIITLHDESRPVDLLTVGDSLRNAGDLERIGGQDALEQLVDSTPTAAHAEFYIELVMEKYIFRAIIESSNVAIDQCFRAEDQAKTILGQAEQALFDINQLERDKQKDWGAVVHDEMEEIIALAEHRKSPNGVKSWFKDLDKMLYGFQPGDMIILAARPSMGKTSLAMNIAEHVATGSNVDTGYGKDSDGPVAVGVFSLEMSNAQLVRRMICSRAGVSSQKVTDGFVNEQERGMLRASCDELRKAKVVLDDTAGLDVLELKSRARRMKQRHDIGLIVIDYLQLLNSAVKSREGRQQEVSHISGQLKAMAKELRIPVLVLSQLSRAPENRKGARGESVPKLSDLRDSGSIEQDADVVLLLRRPSYYPDDKEAHDEKLAIVDVAKHRNGPTGVVRLNFEKNLTRFMDRANDYGGEDRAMPNLAEEQLP